MGFPMWKQREANHVVHKPTGIDTRVQIAPPNVCHELTPHTRAMPESGVMSYAIFHDVVGEAAAVRWMRGAVEGARGAPPFTQILVHTK